MPFESCFARGDLRITLRDARTGAVIRRIQIKNTITAEGLRAMVEVFRQKADPEDFRFKEIRVGKGVTPPERSDAALADHVTTIQLVEASTEGSQINDPYEIKILATLERTQANGVSLCEAAIGMMNGSIFARQIHPIITKNEALVIDYDWRISFKV